MEIAVCKLDEIRAEQSVAFSRLDAAARGMLT